MATNELTSVDSPSWLNKWWMPFLWIILTPIVTVPLSAMLFSVLTGYHGPVVGLPDPAETDAYEHTEAGPMIIAFVLPGLLNLLPFLWVRSGRSMVRTAGIVAGLLGLLCLSIPPTVLMLVFDGVPSYGVITIFVWPLGAVAWFGSLLVWAIFWLTLPSSPGKEGPVTVATAHHSAR